MISYSEQHILEEIIRDTADTLQEIHTLLSKVYDDELALDLNRQAMRCSVLREKAADRLLNAGIIPEPKNILDRARKWGNLQARTALNINTSYVAELLLEEQEKREKSFRKAMENQEVCSAFTTELAEEFAQFACGSRRILKTYC